MPKKKGRRVKRKTHHIGVPKAEQSVKVPKTFVIKTGKVGNTVKELRDDLRKVLEPNTAAKLQEKKTNVLKDFLHVAGELGITHFLIFSSTDFGTYLKVAKFPRGPTLTFRVHNYTLTSDVVANQLRPHTPGVEFKSAPLLVLNNFSGEEEDQSLQLLSTTLQSIFPPLNVQNIRLIDCKRVVLFSYNKQTKMIEFRHYLIKVSTVGISRSIKRIVKKAQLPNLNSFDDIAEYVLGNTGASDSEAEDGPESRVAIPESNTNSVQQSAIRLTELGPRLQLQLVKIQEDFCDGNVVFHEYITKSAEEIELLKEKKEKKEMLKKLRQKEQEQNVMKKKGISNDQANPEKKDQKEKVNEEDEGSDAEWYKQEVGEDLPEDFKRAVNKESRKPFNPLYRKKQKKSTEDNHHDDSASKSNSNGKRTAENSIRKVKKQKLKK